ncbi:MULTISPECIES: LysM peptidoglycan-binding domain-containing protein [Enterococcus]|nr:MULTISPECIES: LysM peptidoglycan-binding domain-containing protein [Enterococcus]ELA81733.1 peptidoglycan-binding protein LysM [Enterococcus faecium EnGen0004]MDK4347348.1 LysM peptidoglycan-binding domain-containing protein [Enterococcus faecium]MDK4385394.1 LysM peptidoglycan-binding domain-containing protein [Enterococcus faecium]MEB4619359.1 LysM peptidoglycan-binding domain-containing protein [Enterococcus sp. E4-223]MEB4619443.1 LysM peptidoglycan-binding domain-containing protein [En
MTSLKTLLFGTTLAAGAAFFMGTTAHADEAYTVQSGDTLSTISQKYVGDNSLINAIAESNSISDINLIYSGQQLTIPTEGSAQATVQEAPVQAEPVQAEQPVVQETVQTETQAAPVAETQAAPAVTETTATPASTSSAKEWIAQKESSGSYTATNGRYIGRYQLDSSYLNGDYSAANQERVAEQYVTSRYGSWEAAKAFWEANGWY